MALPKQMRLTVAAFIASVAGGDVLSAQAQFTIENYNLSSSSSRIHVSAVRTQSEQNDVAEQPTARSILTQGAAVQPNLSQPNLSQPAYSQPGAPAQDANAAMTQGGQLAPIAMESVRAPIAAANISLANIGNNVLPPDEASKEVAAVQPLPGGQERAFNPLTYRWQSANICHWPLYFEEPMLERHGQQICPPCLQPAVSGGKFFTNLFLYPYKATLQPACESRYTLGHFRPGSCAPLLKDTLPWSPRAAVVQGAAVTGVAVGLPW